MRPLIVACAAVALAVASSAPSMAENIRLRPLSQVYVDTEGSSIVEPEGVGCGNGAGIIVADTGNGRLLRFTVTTDTLASAGAISASQVTRPIRAEIASNGDILALDGRAQRIARFASTGAFKEFVEATGAQGNIVPRSFKLDAKDNIYVLDIFSERVLILDPGGKMQRSIAFPEDYGIVADLAVDAKGRVFVVDSVKKTIFTAGKGDSDLRPLNEDLQGKADFPTSIAVDGAGNLFVGDQNAGAILVLAKDGTFRARQSSLGWKSGLLRYPAMLCIDDKDRMFVADRANNRIQVFAIVR